jgi:hypothetical protein
VNSTTDAVALSRKEAMNKMSHHLVDVSPPNFPFSFFARTLDSVDEFYLNSFVFTRLSEEYDLLPWFSENSRTCGC